MRSPPRSPTPRPAPRGPSGVTAAPLPGQARPFRGYFYTGLFVSPPLLGGCRCDTRL